MTTVNSEKILNFFTASCEKIRELTYGIITKNGFKHDESVHFKCNPYYVLKGESVLTCSNGSWTSQVPKCLGILLFLELGTVVVLDMANLGMEGNPGLKLWLLSLNKIVH